VQSTSPLWHTIRIRRFISRREIYIITRGYSPTQLKLSGGLTSIVLMLDTKLIIKNANVKMFLCGVKERAF